MNRNLYIASVILGVSICGNIYLWASRYDLKNGFIEEIRTNIMRHCISGRLDYIKSEFETAKKFKFDIDPKNIGSDCLIQACNYGHSDIVQYLLENGQDSNSVKDCVAMFRNNDTATIKLLIKYKKKFSEIELAHASYWASYEIVKMILESNEYSKEAYTNALFAALSFYPNIDIVKMLISKGAEINKKNKSPIEEFDTEQVPIAMVKYRIQHKWDHIEMWKEILNFLTTLNCE